MLNKTALTLSVIALGLACQPALALNPQPLPPGRSAVFRFMPNRSERGFAPTFLMKRTPGWPRRPLRSGRF